VDPDPGHGIILTLNPGSGINIPNPMNTMTKSTIRRLVSLPVYLGEPVEGLEDAGLAGAGPADDAHLLRTARLEGHA
jgi:hypothetical protein